MGMGIAPHALSLSLSLYRDRRGKTNPARLSLSLLFACLLGIWVPGGTPARGPIPEARV